MNRPNSVRFLNAFAQIEKHLNKITSLGSKEPFNMKLRAGERVSPIVKSHGQFLNDIAELRNAIVHRRSPSNEPIAEPHTEIVERLERVVLLFENPPKVIPEFQREVIRLNHEDTLSTATSMMQEHRISQCPVYRDSEFLGLLTTNTIAFCIGAYMEEKVEDIGSIPISGALEYTEDGENYRFVPRHTTQIEALEAFHELLVSGKRLDGIIITHSGKENEIPLGIITPWDLPKITDLIRIS